MALYGKVSGGRGSIAIVCSPHRPDDAPEPHEEHRRCQVDGLVGLLAVTLSGLARAEEREMGVLEVELHEVGHSELFVLAQVESALERLGGVLSAVTSDVDDTGRLERTVRLLVHGSGAREQMEVSTCRLCDLGHAADLRLDLG
jgi:hypothetical protein